MSNSMKRGVSLPKIAIVGAESSGKSMLAEALAKQFNTLWVPEYLREFVDLHGRVPRAEEQIGIAATQLAREDALAEQAQNWLFCDTTPLMTALYSEHYFGSAEPALLSLAADHAKRYALTLVTAPDTPWVADGLQRESPAVRQEIHEQLLALLEQREIAHVLVQGSLAARLEQVDMFLSFLLG